MTAYQTARRVTAVLGPTNTGKTYLAIERMLGHRTGMIGFPLRLLARENYDKVVRIKGARRVALVTGEEKIIPPSADYFICTVESMPLDRRVDFLAVDEVQLAADAERGHVFTDRLLHARGEHETMLLGADTIRPVIRALVPGAEYIGRPRFSSLSYVGPRKLARIPPRSAVVAFSASDVYALAEHIRHQRGGAAVVLGALSPRTRNAQVAMYQAGEVDYLVATDAIGMGLNMDVDHVTFSALRKFDGRRLRRLEAAEIAQIAGRAGRHMADGSFGTSAELGPLDPATVDAVENHQFEPLRSVWWRNPALKFDSVKTLLKSLDVNPPAPELMRMRGAEDHTALVSLARDDDISRLASTPDMVRLLWDVCRIPDFRKTMTETHTRLLSRIFRHLAAPNGRLPTDWVARQLAQLDRTEGDIDTLMARIAHTRTWTYVSHRADWLDDAGHWQERARAIEDRLSDALHQRLTQRFVDRRAATLSRLRGAKTLGAAIDGDGAVSVEGQFVGHLEGFRFVPDAAAASGEDRRMLVSAAKRALQGDMADRVRRLEAEPAAAFALDHQHRLAWRGVVVARLARGGHILTPRVELLPAEFLTPELRDRARARLDAWLTGHLATALAPLLALNIAALDGAARGLAFQLVEALGSMPRRGADAQIAALSADERRDLRAMGVRLGLESVYLPRLLKPPAVRLRALLWAAWHGRAAQAPVMAPPAPGLVTTPVDCGVPAAFYEAVGYRVLGGRAVRIDILDRVAILIRRRTRKGPVTATADLLTPLGLTADQFAPVIMALGYRATADGAGYSAVPRRRPPRKARPAKAPAATRKPKAGPPPRRKPAAKPVAKIDPDSPFAKLRELRFS